MASENLFFFKSSENLSIALFFFGLLRESLLAIEEIQAEKHTDFYDFEKCENADFIELF